MKFVVVHEENHYVIEGQTQCPNHSDQRYSKSTGDCSCGSNHNRWASSNNPGGQKKSSLLNRPEGSTRSSACSNATTP